MPAKRAASRVQPYSIRTRSSNNGCYVKSEENTNVKNEEDSPEPSIQPRTNTPSEQSDTSSFYLIQDDREISDNGMDSDDSSDNSGKTWLAVLSSSEEEMDEDFDRKRSIGLGKKLPTGSPRLKKVRMTHGQIKKARAIQKSSSERVPVYSSKMIDVACQTNRCCGRTLKMLKNATTMTLPLSVSVSQTRNRTQKDSANGNQSNVCKQEKNGSIESSRGESRGQSVAKVVPQVLIRKHPESGFHQCRRGTIAYGFEEGRGRSRRSYKRVSDLFSDVRYYYSTSGPGHEDWKKRYEEEDGKVYLGEGIYIDSFRWWCIKALKRPACFLKNLAIEMWTEDELANRSFEPELISERNRIPGKPPPRLVEPNLLRLIMSIYYDYLCDNTTMEETERMKFILKATADLSSKMCQLRSEKCHGPLRDRH